MPRGRSPAPIFDKSTWPRGKGAIRRSGKGRRPERMRQKSKRMAHEGQASPPPQPSFVLRPVGVPGNGDCLFYAVGRILIDWLDRLGMEAAGLGSASAPAAAVAPEPPTRAELDEVARYLRGRVAARVLDPEDEGSEETLAAWWRLWSDAQREKNAELMVETRHMQGVAGGALTLADRRLIFRNMMDPRIYWGDDFALRSLEAVLGCRLCVVNESMRVVKREHGADERTTAGSLLPPEAMPAGHRPFLGMLILAHAHYEPLCGPGGVLAWDMAALPTPLSKLVTQWLG